MSRNRTARRLMVTALATALALSACGTPPADGTPLSGTLAVFAPTSLTEVLSKLVQTFQATHSGVVVKIVFGADSESSQRATVGTTGAAVLITEGPAPITALGASVTTPVRLATDQLVIAIPLGDPKGIASVADLARPDLHVVTCAQTEPCGTLSAAVLSAAGVSLPATATTAPDVRAARAEVQAGTADAALVYRTDTRAAADRVDTVEFAQSSAALAHVEAVAVANRPSPQTAQAFLDFLTADPAQAAFAAAGFQAP